MFCQVAVPWQSVKQIELAILRSFFTSCHDCGRQILEVVRMRYLLRQFLINMAAGDKDIVVLHISWFTRRRDFELALILLEI